MTKICFTPFPGSSLLSYVIIDGDDVTEEREPWEQVFFSIFWVKLANVISVFVPVSLWFSWLKPFKLDLWIAILITCNVILFVVWWLDRKSPKGYYHILKNSDEDAFTLLGTRTNVT